MPKILHLPFALLVLCSFSLLQPLHAQLPPLAASVEDPSTGLNVQPGFVVEKLYQVDKAKYGSWISMAFDGQGRLTVSDQGKAGTFLLDVPELGGTFDESSIRMLDQPKSLWGMLYAFDHLYMMPTCSRTANSVQPR